VAYITVGVQSDLLPELGKHLVQRWTAIQQRIVDFKQLLIYELISDIVRCFKTNNIVEFLSCLKK